MDSNSKFGWGITAACFLMISITGALLVVFRTFGLGSMSVVTIAAFLLSPLAMLFLMGRMDARSKDKSEIQRIRSIQDAV